MASQQSQGPRLPAWIVSGKLLVRSSSNRIAFH